MIWSTLRGHDEQVVLFQRAAARGRLAHAYLFAGPEGVGKSRFARVLAQCLFCERTDEADLEACGECPPCRQMAAGSHPDFFFVGRPAGKKELPLETFLGSDERRGREGLCYELSLKPMEAHRRIAVIDDADTMSLESANAILKTLEEPPARSLLILIASNIDALLPTIRSRCQQVRFPPLPESDVAELLREQQMVPDRAEAESVAGLSGGSLAVAAQLLDPAYREIRDTLYEALAKGRFNSLALAEALTGHVAQLGGDTAGQREAAGWVIRFALEFYRHVLLCLSSEASAASMEPVERFAARLDPDSPEDLELVMSLFERTAEAEAQLERNVSVPLCLEGLCDGLARVGRGAVPA